MAPRQLRRLAELLNEKPRCAPHARVRLLAIALVVLAMTMACGGGSSLSLQQVEAAFAQNGVHFQCVWQIGGGGTSVCGQHVTDRRERRANIRAWAYTVDGPTVTVFDSPTSATAAASLARRQGGGPRGDTVIVVRDVVYHGPNSAPARRAMNSLRK